MKKITMLILIIIIPFCIFIIISNTPRNYKTEYSINKLEVTEKYDKDNQTYLFIIKDNKLEIPYQIIHKYIKKRKLITNIKVEENCYTISVFESDHKLCTNDDKIIIDSNINNESPINTENNKEIYKNSEKIFIWNYKGYYKIENNKLENITILKNDNYENKISISNDKYLVTANYDEKYEFTKFYRINIKSNKIDEIISEKPISSNSYFLGTHNNKLYLLDPKYKNEYEIDPNKKKITMISKDGNGIYYDKEEVKTSLNKLIKEKLVFSTYNLYNYNIEDNKLTCKRANEELFTKSIHGTTNALIENMIIGVSKGYTVELETVGVGYRFQVTGKQINVSAGFSHPVVVDIPEGITVEAPSTTELKLSGIDKQKVTEFAANIRKIRKPEPYKGKGIRYKGEVIRRKEGKKASK